MIKARNFICAAPLVRLQLDNSLRFYAAFLVEEPHELAKAFIDGKSIRSFRERGSKEKLTDRILVDRLSLHHSWIKEAYKQASGYIHLSEKHFFNVIGRKTREDKLSFVAGAIFENKALHEMDIIVFSKLSREKLPGGTLYL